MVQYVHTPWRDRAELLRVRQQFYPTQPPPPLSVAGTSARASATAAPAAADLQDAESQRRRAVSRVSIWMQRGSCPHMVESTSLLTAALLNESTCSSALRLAYSSAFSRYVCLFPLSSLSRQAWATHDSGFLRPPALSAPAAIYWT